MKGRIWQSVTGWGLELWKSKLKLAIVLILVIAASLASKSAGDYVDSIPTAAPSDLILDAIPPIDVGFIYVAFFLIALFLGYFLALFIDTGRYYYYAGMFALLAIVRSGFIILTHLQGHPDYIVAEFPPILAVMVFSNDLFFSGHTAFPFLAFLIYKPFWAKAFFLISSIILATSTLLMHAHYSIDVFAAFFITYGVYKIGNRVFESKVFKKLD